TGGSCTLAKKLSAAIEPVLRALRGRFLRISPPRRDSRQFLHSAAKISEFFTDRKWSGPRWRKTIGAVSGAGPRRQAAAYPMTNIPTELLRTLVTVVELRSFTKAAQCLGMTQPAVSAQIKRLQILLGGELLDKSAPGVALTPKGETVVRRARQLLSVNDRIVEIARPRAASGVRIGIANEVLSSMLSSVLGACRRGSPGSPEIRESEDPLRDLKQGEL